MQGRDFYTYILSNKNNTVLYVGVTNDIERRVWEHKTHFNAKSFTARYNIEKLVYYEHYDSILAAIAREKQLKGGSRAKKEALINLENTEWRDLSEGWYDEYIAAALQNKK